MLFDPRASSKPGNAIAVEQRRLRKRFFHAENVTGFNAPSNLEKSSCYQAILPYPPSNSPTKFRDEPKEGTMGSSSFGASTAALSVQAAPLDIETIHGHPDRVRGVARA